LTVFFLKRSSSRDEITAGAEVLMQKIKMYRPKIVAFNGRGIYEVYAGNKHFHYGKQPDLFPGTDTVRNFFFSYFIIK
jgi:TDG/mug DNA glycosylase family protein